MTADPVKIAQDSIRCPSVTPLDEGAQQVLIDVLEPLGFECHTLQFDDITNLFARIGNKGPHLCYCGHTDVVPPGDEADWTHPPFDAVIDDGWLYGRGAADMKSNNAAFVAAIAAYINEHGKPPGSVSLLITGDEEGESINGTVKVLEWMKDNGQIPDAALVGEPSNPERLGDELKIGRRGSLSGNLTVKGKQGHVAYPKLADNPLPGLLALLQALVSHRFDEGSEFFQPTNLEISSIDVGNPADNVIPAKGTARFNIRFNDKWTSETLEVEIRRVLDSVGGSYELEMWGNAESFLTAPGSFTDLLRDAVTEVTGRTPALTTNGGTSDARFVTHYCPVAEFGLVNKTIHQVDERVRTEDIRQLTEIYKLVIEKFFKDFAGG